MTLEQLQQQCEALRTARYQGVLTVRAGDKWVTYKSDAEMRAALAAIDREIAVLQGRPRRRRLLTYGKKGF